MVHGAAVEYCEIVGIVLVGTLIGAVFLQISCALYNMLAGSSGEPSASGGAVEEAEPAVQSEMGPARTPGGAGTEDESTAITTAPLTKPARTAGDNWPDYERMAALPGVPKPRFELAMGIIFVAALGNGLANFVLFRILRLAGQAAGPGVLTSIPILLFSVPLGILILSGTIAVMLPTRFGKALLIALLYSFFSALLAAILFIVLVLFR